jgi:hypothetical protein
MLPGLVLSLAVAATSVAVAQTSPATPAGKGDKGSNKTSNLVALVGCVSPNPNQPGGFMLSESDQLSQYKLTGTSMRDYAGKRVQVYGEPPKRLKVVGGLYPTPNSAAEGGRNHVKDAMAAATPANTPGGSAALPEFKVKSIQVVTGTCADQ